MTDEGSAIKPLAVEKARDVAKFYGVPESLVNLMIVEFNGVAYPKEPFLLYVGHRRGIQSIEVTKPVEGGGEWTCEARIFPKVQADARFLAELGRLSQAERERMWAYLTKPTVEWGRASKANVRMSTMQGWLPELAIKRAVCRALRLFAGVGMTAFEELPEAKLERNEIEPSEEVKMLDKAAPDPAQPSLEEQSYDRISWRVRGQDAPLPLNSGPAVCLKKTFESIERSHIGVVIVPTAVGDKIVDIGVAGADEKLLEEITGPLSWALEKVHDATKSEVKITPRRVEGTEVTA